MKLSAWLLAALTPVAVWTSGAFLGHLVVLAVTLGIFFGTLSLGRSSRPAMPAAQAPLLPVQVPAHVEAAALTAADPSV